MGRRDHRSRAIERERIARGIAAGLSYAEAHRAHLAGQLGPAELACAYVAERVHRAAGPRWLQAERTPPIATAAPSPLVRLFAERELCRMPRAVPEALCAWADGARPVELLFHVPTPREVLALQAEGRRCVSLLDDDVPTAPHADGLAFAVHDLCHLEKFMDPAHHEGQVGFFAAVDRALGDPRWLGVEAALDPVWIDDRDHVIADMNGSPAFLFMVLKNKLKLAVRRRVARERGALSPAGGPLDDAEAAACAGAYEALLAALGLAGEPLRAARALSSRIDAVALAPPLIGHFEAAGRAALSARSPAEARPV